MNLADVCIRRPVFATMLVSSLVVLGLFCYRLLGLDLFPNFDVPVVTVTTVGYREVHDLSRTGQVFTVALLFSGVGAALYTADVQPGTSVAALPHGRSKRSSWSIPRSTPDRCSNSVADPISQTSSPADAAHT